MQHGPPARTDRTAPFPRVRRRIGAAARLALALAILLITRAEAVQRHVTDARELDAAIASAAPGDVITLSPGKYRIGRTEVRRAGTASRPITVRADLLGLVTIETAAVEAFVVMAPYWIFENLEIVGTCRHHGDCEHAFHIVGRASHTVVRNNVMREFNAMIKGNGLGDPRVFPNDVLIENNAMYNATIRNTDAPVTPIDVVGGRRWIVRANFIADFAKGASDETSYAAFLKGNSQDGVFERNLVVCEWRHSGGIRVGLSFGGGGTSPASLCEERDCSAEHRNGIMRNNIIAFCRSEVGIYLNKAKNTRIYNNTLFETNGIDVRFPQSDADVRNNIISGAIRDRDGGQSAASNNLAAGSWMTPWLPGGTRYLREKLARAKTKYPNYVFIEEDLVGRISAWLGESCLGRCPERFRSWFANPDALDFTPFDGADIIGQGEPLAEVADDFCGAPRGAPPVDIGAIEYDRPGCDARARLPRIGPDASASLR